MIPLPRVFFIFYLIIFATSAQATEVGAYWAFQEESQGAGPTDATFTENVSVNTWPSGIPSFSYAGSRTWNFGNYGPNHTPFDGPPSWIPGRAFGWNVSRGASTGNTFQVTLNTTDIEDLNVKLRYRLNGTQTSSGAVEGFSAFEYSVDGEAFIAVPGVSLSLANNTNYNNFWQADLSAVTAIENSELVTLRWTLPNLVQGSSKQIRMDDLEVTALFDPVTYTSSSIELLELRSLVGTYSPISFAASIVNYGLSGADAADFDISSSGELTFKDGPVYSSQPITVVVEMSDPANASKLEYETVSITVLKSAAITTRERHHPTGQYNVLFIPVDDLRPLLNVYGEDDPLRPITINGDSGTPNFDRLAASGVTFLNAHCQQAICTASRVSFLTGLRPDTTRNWNLETNFRDIMPNVVTLPQQFSENGYKTYGVGKIFHGQNSSKQDDNHSSGADSWNEGWENPSAGRFNFYERGDNPEIWNTWDKTATAGDPSNVSATDVGEYKRESMYKIEDSDYKDGRAAELAVEKIAEYASDGATFFLGLGFQKPHLPFNAPKDYWDLYDPNAINMSFYKEIRDMPEGTNSFTSPYGGEPSSYGDGETYLPTVAEPDLNVFFVDRMPSVDSARHLIHGYMACVSFIDAQLGKVLDALEDPNGDGSDADSIADNTIVILFGDHGFHLGDHGAFWAKHSNYEISTRVPFIIRSPGMSSLGSRGKMTSSPVELVDIFPTLLDLCSLPVPSTTTRITAEDDTELYQVLEGTSLVPLLEDPEQPWKSVAFSQYQRYISKKPTYDSDVPLTSAGGGKGMGYSIRTDRYRYTEWWKTNGDYGKFGSTDPDKPPYDPDASRVVAGQASFVELYDYQNDPGETENLAYTQASTYATLISELQGLLHDSDNSDYVGDGWKKDFQASPYNVPASYPVTKSQWASLHQSPGRNPTEFADNEDPDQDGIPNLMEYAMGTHPLEANNDQVSMAETAGAIELQYPEVSTRGDVSIIPETSVSMNSNSWSAITSTTTDAVGSKSIKKASLPTSGARGFLRLRAVEE